MSYVNVGDSVLVHDELGIVRFAGSTDFASGIWLGVEMVDKVGRNDGSIQGKRYFTCEEGKGVFIRACSTNVRKQTDKTRVNSDSRKKPKSIDKQTSTKASYKAKENKTKEENSKGRDNKKKVVCPSLNVSTPTKVEGSNVSTPLLELTADSETTLISIGSDSLEDTPINESFKNDKRASIDFTNSRISAPHLLLEEDTIIESNTKFQLKLEIETLHKELNEALNSLNYYKTSHNKANEQLKKTSLELEELNKEKEMNSAWKSIRPKLQKKMLSMQEEIEILKQQLKHCKLKGQGIENEFEDTEMKKLTQEDVITEKPADMLVSNKTMYEVKAKDENDGDYACSIDEIKKENLELKIQVKDLQLLKELSDEIERDQSDKIASLEKEDKRKAELFILFENTFSQNIENLQTQKLQREQTEYRSFHSTLADMDNTAVFVREVFHNLANLTKQCYEFRFEILQKLYLDDESGCVSEISFMLFYIQKVSSSFNQGIYNKINQAENGKPKLSSDFIEQWYYIILVTEWSKWLIAFTCENGAFALSSDLRLKDTIIDIFHLFEAYVKDPGGPNKGILQDIWGRIENWVKERASDVIFNSFDELYRCVQLLNSVFLIDMVTENIYETQIDDSDGVLSEISELAAITKEIKVFLQHKDEQGKVFFPKEKIISPNLSSVVEKLLFESQNQGGHSQNTYPRIIKVWKEFSEEIRRSLLKLQSYIVEKGEAVFSEFNPQCFRDVILTALPSPSKEKFKKQDLVKENSSLKLAVSETNELITHLKIQIDRLSKQTREKEDLEKKIKSFEVLESGLRKELMKTKSDQKNLNDNDHLMKVLLEEKQQLEETFKQNEQKLRMKFQEMIRKLKQDLNKARKEVLHVDLDQKEDYEWLSMSLSHRNDRSVDNYMKIPQRVHSLALEMKPFSVNRYFDSERTKKRERPSDAHVSQLFKYNEFAKSLCKSNHV
ncbi:hypothetical protein SPOG_01666 [Schizosaccharomyces cryophilus OY26]|uniref:CAP-Gly domain-containing protein n=1 Tax=Schizosaccharomyces cryophilus (strain OY26 / ATCC MYA-4695 / CBS 11777 / NBRC 106824 / NRRL Y48691) TaxID=653667 RepID=S9W319_SCHCR|nr:uncharacterized protein SPOG_01666 [Schizosaccharomyces cryophilus OY26]EPY52340.1 hypothetical protein SPOG_01666 [Schizosaccharomyces cryophilus OY26]